MPKNTLVIAVTTGKGGAEFERECNKFEAHHNALGNFVTVHKLKHDKQWKQYHRVLRIINNYPGKIDRLVFFCHGTWKKLKCGFHIWNVDDLVSALKPKVGASVCVALYACSCGRARFEWPWSMTKKEYSGIVKGKEGFAARLCKAFESVNIAPIIYCHSSWGHTTRNPYVYEYHCQTGIMRVGRAVLCQKGSAGWKPWRERLKTDYRFDAPFE